MINPQRFGTGLSIKSVDALLHGRPLVTTASGARGLEDGAGTAYRPADSAEEFGDEVVRLLRDPGEAVALAGQALGFAREYHQRNVRSLAELVSVARKVV